MGVFTLLACNIKGKMFQFACALRRASYVNYAPGFVLYRCEGLYCGTQTGTQSNERSLDVFFCVSLHSKVTENFQPLRKKHVFPTAGHTSCIIIH